MIRKLKTIDRPDGTRIIVDQRGAKPLTIYSGPRDGVPVDVQRLAQPVEPEKKPRREPKPNGLGDLVAAGLAKVGVTKERYVRFKQRCGLAPQCGCSGRVEKLNALGRVVAKYVRRK